ncbi:FAD-binding oxidoreductase [Amycolatopsis alkalitolerans]|uniref:FAD-binding oxidoreductase n=1 Tax=Amycolatopsis alkalitolerans TaxID=2547244 RepID=A0A5C4M2S0_9PSEU|nr:FAD-binding oxidoreductase [Amycolatopsis alkalitolerans]TNC25190.1 FAD-binding oxidoreductase [Amycolatopsis alkalitolerans]
MDAIADTAQAALDAARELRPTFRGDLVLPQDPGYDNARRVWNGCIDRRPALIARCRCTEDVVAALGAARARGLEIAVRGGGHSIAGLAVADKAVTIDLSGMAAIRVDPSTRQASVHAGSLLASVDRETQRHGLAVTSGFVSHTGVGGLTLGGGFGWMARKHGLACDNVRSAEVVLADGTVATAGDTDLLWALRGAGSNFGVTTSFEFELHPVGPMVATGTACYALEDGAQVLRALRELADEAADETTWAASIWDADQDTPVPAEHHGKPVVTLTFVHIGDVDEGLRLGRRLHAVASPLAETVGPVTYLDLQCASDGAWPHGVRRYWKSHYLWDLPDAAIEVFLARGNATGKEHPPIIGSLQARGGAISRVGEQATAVGHRGAKFEFLTASNWTDAGEDDARRGLIRTFADAMARYSHGVYVNNLGTEGEDRVRAAYGDEKFTRLVSLKRRYDPDNVFHLNQNIRP